MRRYLLLFILILNFVIIDQPLAQQIQTLTYEDAINIALKKSYTVKSYLQNKIAMQQYFNYSKAEFKPRLDFNIFTPSWSEGVELVRQINDLPAYISVGEMQFGGNLQFIYTLPTGGNLALSSLLLRNNVKTVSSSTEFGYVQQRDRKAYSSLNLSFNQPVFTKNTLKENLNEARYLFEQSSSRFTRGQMNIIYSVTRGFYMLYRATREVEIAREKLKNSEEAYRIAKLKGETGRIPEGDVLIAEVAAAQNKANLSESIGNLEREKDQFKQLIGLNLDKEIQIITSLRYDTFNIDLDKAIEEALKNRLEIYESELDLKLQEIEVDRANRVRELKGNISAYYNLTGISPPKIGGTTRELFEYSFDDFVDRPPNRGITFSLSYPIFDWGRGSAREQQEQAKLRETELSYEDTKVTVIREVRDVVRSVEEAKNRLQINEKNQEVAQRSYEISRMRFENGDITSQELGVEQERLATTQLNYLDAFITYQLAVADLKRKTMWDFQNDRSYLKEDYLVDSEK
ncbi:MAG: TolC family protein [bacterium]|nr:MAG: TolC family protein [bacterium]